MKDDAELVTTGTWTVLRTKEATFVKAWAAFADWTSPMQGAGTLRRGSDVGDFESLEPNVVVTGAGGTTAFTPRARRGKDHSEPTTRGA